MLQSSYRGVDIVRQGGELLISPHIHVDIQITIGNLRQGNIDLMDVVHNQPLDEEIDLGKQCREYQHLHKYLNGDGDIAGEHSLGDGDGGNEVETFCHAEHTEGVHMIDHCLKPGAGWHLELRSVADGKSVFARVAAVVADNGQRLIADDNTAGLTDMTIFHRQTDLPGDGTLKLVGIVAYLHKAALRQRHAGIFAGDGAVISQRLIALHKALGSVQQAKKLCRLFSGCHIKTHKLRHCTLNDYTIGADNADAGHIILLRQCCQLRTGADGRYSSGYSLGGMQQIIIRHIPHIIFHIVQIQREQLVGIGVGNAGLQRIGEDARDSKGHDDTDQQEQLEHLRELIGTFAPHHLFLADERHQQQRQHYRHTIAGDHERRTLLYHLECGEDIIHIGDKHEQHMQNLCGHADSQTIEPRGLLVVEHILPANRTDQSCRKGAKGACQLAEYACAPVGSKPTVYAAYDAGDDARRTAEQQACRQWSGVSNIQNCTVDRDACLCGQHGDETE